MKSNSLLSKISMISALGLLLGILAACSSGSGSGSSSSVGVLAADTPTDVTAINSATGEIEVTWSGQKNDSRYKVAVLQQADYSISASVKGLDIATSPQKIAGFASGTYYVFVIPVELDDSDGIAVPANNGAAVVVGSAGTPDGGTDGGTGGDSVSEPEIPSNVGVVSNNDGQITATWDGDSFDGSYTLVINTSASLDSPLIEQVASVSGAVVSGLTTNNYYVWIVAYDAAGNELYVVEANGGVAIAVINTATDPAEAPANVVSSFSVSAMGRVSVSWSGDVKGGSYSIIIDDDALFSDDIPTRVINNATSIQQISSLDTGEYFVWVVPYDHDGLAGTAIAANNGAALMVYNGAIDTAVDEWPVFASKSTIIPVANLIANDANNITDSEVDPLEIIEVKDAVGGTVSLNGANITFTSTGAVGESAYFTYVVRIKDNNLFSEQVVVTMNVIAAPSVIANADNSAVQQGGDIYFTISVLMSNDEGSSLSFVGVQNVVGGTVNVVGENITFTSTGLAYEVAQFDYVIKDNLNTEATGTVFIAVNPLAAIDAFIYDDAAIFEEQKVTYAPPTMQNVFNSWARFDGNNYFEDKDAAGITSNASAWQLLDTPYRVSMPLNVDPYNGFLSPQALENYTFEATVTSPNADNDGIGLVIAFVRIEGVNYSLTAMRTRTGSVPTSGWGVVYNINNGTKYNNPSAAEGKVVQEMTVPTTATGGWSNKQSRIKVVRAGNIIKCYTTNWNNTGTYEASSEITIDLDADTDLHKFKGAQPYGYISFSQPDTTYLDIAIDGGLDASTMSFVNWSGSTIEVWTYDVDNSQWVCDTSQTLQQVYGYVREVQNPVTGKRYLIKEHSVELIP